MNCQHAVELLPWLLNGTLEAGERQAVEEHLERCESCRGELQETLLAGRIFSRHLPAEALVAQAAGDPYPGLPADLVAGHLADCPSCAEELALIREGRERLAGEGGELPQAEPGGKVVRGPWGTTPVWRAAALAASLVGLVALGGWLRTWNQAGALRSDQAAQLAAVEARLAALEAENIALRSGGEAGSDRLEQLEAEVRELEEERASLAGRLDAETLRVADLAARLDAPRLGVETLDLALADKVLRGDAEEGLAEARRSWGRVVLLPEPPAGLERHTRMRLEVVDESGRVVRRVRGRVTGRDSYTVELPTAELPLGTLTIDVYAEGDGGDEKLASYRLRIVP